MTKFKFKALVLGDYWVLLILYILKDGKLRYNGLKDRLEAIHENQVSSRTLAQRLDFMEANGLILREVFAEVPTRVMYELTMKAKEINDVLLAAEQRGI